MNNNPSERTKGKNEITVIAKTTHCLRYKKMPIINKSANNGSVNPENVNP